MTTSPAIIRQPAEGETLSVVGDQMRVLADSASSSGACAIFEETSTFGVGPPMHRHARDDEHFYVLAGLYKFSVNGQESILGPGGYAFAPRRSVHTFLNITPTTSPTPGRMLVVCTPGGLENPFRVCDRLAKEGNNSIDAAVEAFKQHDLEILGPPLSP
jgi:quercetin dioxygenase-like cupin family protein